MAVGMASFTINDAITKAVATRPIPAHIPSQFITLVTTVTVTAAGGVILFPLGGWTPPSGRALGLLALAAILVLVGYQYVIMALRAGDISAVAPFRYTALLWAMLLGYLLFGDRPDAMMVTGASIIVLSGLYASHRERIRHRLMAARATWPAAGRGVIVPQSFRHALRILKERFFARLEGWATGTDACPSFASEAKQSMERQSKSGLLRRQRSSQ